MNGFSGFSRMVGWARLLAEQAATQGAAALDLTVGNGNDTLWLARAVGPGGRVAGFDVQHLALSNAKALLESNGVEVRLMEGPDAAGGPTPTSFEPGVTLINDDHANLDRYRLGTLKVVVANLGYLPGYEEGPATGTPSTLAALGQSLELLESGGRLVTVCYPGHPGGAEEAEAVSLLIESLPASEWRTLQLHSPNVPACPFLLAAERKAPR